MMENILIRPIITEKAAAASEKQNCYAFVVSKDANKVQIRKAVEASYGVTVEGVRTSIVPARQVVRFTKSGVLAGKKSSYKKAVVEVRSGETIDIYSNL